MRHQRSILSLMIMLLVFGSLWAVAAGAQSPRRRPPQLPRSPSYPPVINPIQWGLGVGVNIPFDVTEKILDVSPSLHGTLLYQLDPAVKIEADLGYWFLQAASEEDEDPSLLTLTGGLRYYLNSTTARDEGPHIDGGLGLYHFSAWDHTVDGVTTSDDSQNKVGFYGGVGFTHVPFDVTVRIHKSALQTDDFWSVGVAVRYFFSSRPSGRRLPSSQSLD